MRQSQKNYKRIVVKIGSSLFYSGKKLDILRLSDLVSNISSLIRNEGKEIVIVSSGAIALGMNAMKLKARPKDLPLLQAAAAIGQNILMDNYSEYFKKSSTVCAQVLLTWDDFDSRQRYLNAKNTLLTLLSLGTVPVINENDTISTDEIRFGDNDRLSALVATLINADLLIILSDVSGLLDRDKNLVRFVGSITPEIKALACPSSKKTCVGGMITKIEAAHIAVNSGIPCVITSGEKGENIFDAVKDPEAGGAWTLFSPRKTSLAAKQRWIAFGTKPKGTVFVDDGAARALLNKKSLLSVGISGLEGAFDAGDIVSIRNKQGEEFARGKVLLSSRQLQDIKGSHYPKEIIHRDNIAVVS